MGDLKTCPFCGGKAFWRGAGGWCGIGCLTDKCPAYMHALMFRESADAEAVWNRRASNERNAQLQDHITHAIGLLRGAYGARVDVAWPTVDEFAQQIRWLNGSNKMGAGTLAEKLLEWLQSRIAGVNGPVTPSWVRLADSDWVNIVNAPSVLDPMKDKEEAVREAVKLTEEKLRLLNVGPWCCEKGRAAGVEVCRECAEESAGYLAAMSPRGVNPSFNDQPKEN